MGFKQRIVTWNVLSSALSSPSTFVKCERRYLDPEYRLRLVTLCSAPAPWLHSQLIL
jgi:hypothetical protein